MLTNKSAVKVIASVDNSTNSLNEQEKPIEN